MYPLPPLTADEIRRLIGALEFLTTDGAVADPDEADDVLLSKLRTHVLMKGIKIGR